MALLQRAMLYQNSTLASFGVAEGVLCAIAMVSTLEMARRGGR
jgi:hypothetical protein